MNLKKIIKTILFPHIAVICCLLPISTVLLTFSLVYYTKTNTISAISYALSFYTLLVVCLRIPDIIAYFKLLKKENKYFIRLSNDAHLRINICLYGSFIWDTAFAIFQLCLGLYHNSLWFYSMTAYYLILAVMRFLLLKHTKNYKANEEVKKELQRYYTCGWLLLFLNIALAVIISFIVYQNKTFHYHEITTITLATYTFITFTYAIISIFKYKKYNSPVYSATKTISLIAGCVSMLTLEATMLTTFGNDNSPAFQQIMLAITGAVVAIFAIATAITMIINGSIKLKQINQIERQNENH